MQFSLLRPILRALCRDHCQSLINNDEKVSSSKQKPNSRQKCKNLSLFMTKTAKAIPFWASQYSPYERFTPPALKFSRPKKYLGRGGMGTLGFEWWVFKTQAAGPSSQCGELALPFFFFTVMLTLNVTYTARIYYYITAKFDYVKRDSTSSPSFA